MKGKLLAVTLGTLTVLLSACAAPAEEIAPPTLPPTEAAAPISAAAEAVEGQAAGDYDLSAAIAGYYAWMEDATPGALGLLAQTEEVALYGIGGEMEDRALVVWGEASAEFDWSFGGPQRAQPGLWCFDLDRDGQEEAVVVNFVGSGAGASVWDLHVLERTGETLTDYCLPWTLRQLKLRDLVSVHPVGDRLFAALGRELVDITDALEGREIETVTGIGVGPIVSYDVDWPESLEIRFHGSTALDSRDVGGSWHAAKVSAAVTYENGAFTLSDFHLDSYPDYG